jgi:AAA15 family ATPase/GTPase
MNILVGPNNSGKSTILAAFRILSQALRKAQTRHAELVDGPNGQTFGWQIDLKDLSIAEENLFFNYDDSEPASINFSLSSGVHLTLYFPASERCVMVTSIPAATKTPTTFKEQIRCAIGFVPILGPVEHHEPLYDKEAARRALYNHRASRNFRNIWYHYSDAFEDFRSTLQSTWPGMDINPPELNTSAGKPHLIMLCPEERIPREIFWAGFGFQVWCQMLTHLIQSRSRSIFLIDEPDIYLHSDLQRQLVQILRDLGPDIIIATHSTEIVSEAEADEILVVNKKHTSARRIKNPSDLTSVFDSLGSNLNPVLTQLAKTRRVLFVEGKDFQIIRRFAQKLGESNIGSQRGFAVFPIEGFNPQKMKHLKEGIEKTLETEVAAAIVLDGDYRCDEEKAFLTAECEKECDLAIVHQRKEIENFLLVKDALVKAAEARLRERARRSHMEVGPLPDVGKWLEEFADQQESYILGQRLSEYERFMRSQNTTIDKPTLNKRCLEHFRERWDKGEGRIDCIPGKEALSFINRQLGEVLGISLTPTSIIESMPRSSVPNEMEGLVAKIKHFLSRPLP